MTLSRQSLEILLDLVEIKTNALQIQDREDARELNKLRKCRQELLQEISHLKPPKKEPILKSKVCLNKPHSTATYRC